MLKLVPRSPARVGCLRYRRPSLLTGLRRLRQSAGPAFRRLSLLLVTLCCCCARGGLKAHSCDCEDRRGVPRRRLLQAQVTQAIVFCALPLFVNIWKRNENIPPGAEPQIPKHSTENSRLAPASRHRGPVLKGREPPPYSRAPTARRAASRLTSLTTLARPPPSSSSLTCKSCQ